MNPKTQEQSPQSSGLFELTAATIIFAPIVFFIASYFLGESAGIFLSLLLPTSLNVMLYYYSSEKRSLKELLCKSEIETFVFFVASFSFFLWACLQWPDFIAIGERLRDYALLSAVMDSPIVAREPWMQGENLNYYLYWYRFGTYWASIFGVSVWNTYHLLAAFTFAIFASSLFRLMRCYLAVSLQAATIISVLILLGSNFAGVLSAFSGSSEWWGPSRVIKGTINEFPAWSFLLGDLHPHFLNLALTPLLLCIACALTNLTFNWALRLALVLLLFLVGGALHYNSNAWEVPMAGITFGLILLLAIFAFKQGFLEKIKSFPKQVISQINQAQVLLIFAALILSLISLSISCSNLKPADYPWRWVKEPIPASTFAELLQHWGIPFFSILLALLLRLRSLNSLVCALILTIGVTMQNGLVILLGLSAWVSLEAFIEINTSKPNKEILKHVLLYGLGISSLVLIILGELIFLDDPYGGENERMNTIFKIYSATWAPLHLFAFCLLYKELIAAQLSRLLIPAALLLIAILPAFFIHTIKLRKNSNPSMQGLASIEQQFPGSADAIRFLRGQPRRTLLESQGNAYSYTSHVATLGGQDSYLGWANHVGLLTGKHEEVGRREKVSEQIFKEANCEIKRELAQKEKIDLIAVGALEKQKYGDLVAQGFGCFPKLFVNTGYLVLAVK